MASNLREGSQGVVHVTAAAVRTAGVPVVEQGWAGFPVTNAAIGDVYSLDCRPYIKYEITKIGAEAKGDYVYITVADNTLSLTAAAGKRLFAKVVEAENGTTYGTPAGKTLVALQPQVVTQ
jgi:hypothetical protein